MKLAYLARFEHSWSTETHVARDAEALGHIVDRINVEDIDHLEARASEADLLVCHATGLSPALTPLWRRLERRGVRTTSYHLDLYAGLRRWAQVDTDPFWRTGTVFTADGDPGSAQAFAAKGIDHRWLPAAVVSDETEPGEWRDEYDFDVVFVGAENYHPEWPWRRQLLDGLRAHFGEQCRVFGHHPPIRGVDLNDLYATARVVVGDTLTQGGHRNFWSDRYYETLGRGGVLIAPHVPGLDRHLADGVDYLSYTVGKLDELLELVEIALDRPEYCRKIAATGHAHVIAEHTYRHRVGQMLHELGVS